jgi:hypothetical protein
MNKTFSTIIVIIAAIAALAFIFPDEEVNLWDSFDAFGRTVATFIVFGISGFIIYLIHKK